MGRYTRYYFCVEGAILKFGRHKDSKKLKYIDLNEAFIEVVGKSKTQRKLKLTSTNYTFTLKADSKEERDQWFAAVNRVTQKNNKALIAIKSNTQLKMAQ
mmetsp:Transcript_22798/g.17240  ORF Transcript_22798/g.17240 Transcript_22798/m.17240 type:complete len:100 (+) Transcript_22798:128-427(+)